jgi:hypothetical protein
MRHITVYGLALLLITTTTAALAGGRGHGGYHGGNNYRHGGHHYRPHRPYRHYSNHYRQAYYYPSYLGAALIGSAFSYSLSHNHNGTSCYENHSNDRYRQSSGGYNEVVGCHRIERLPDGTERRIEVPVSQCQ